MKEDNHVLTRKRSNGPKEKHGLLDCELKRTGSDEVIEARYKEVS